MEGGGLSPEFEYAFATVIMSQFRKCVRERTLWDTGYDNFVGEGVMSTRAAHAMPTNIRTMESKTLCYTMLMT